MWITPILRSWLVKTSWSSKTHLAFRKKENNTYMFGPVKVESLSRSLYSQMKMLNTSFPLKLLVIYYFIFYRERWNMYTVQWESLQQHKDQSVQKRTRLWVYKPTCKQSSSYCWSNLINDGYGHGCSYFSNHDVFSVILNCHITKCQFS